MTEPTETPSDAPIRVLIVDDHAMVRQGLRSYLETVAGIVVVDEAVDGQAAIEKLSRFQVTGELPDVVLADLMMPRMDGERLTREVVARFPAVRVVVMTSFSELARIQALLQAGATGYVLKDSDPSQIDSAIRAAFAGQVHLDPVAARVLTQSLVHREAPELSAREREVVKLVAEGLSNQEVARRLVMSERTARTHVSNILMKLGLESRTQAALWALKEGVATLHE